MHTVFLLDEETPTVFEQSRMFLDILNDISQDKIKVELDGDNSFNGNLISCTKVHSVSDFRKWIWDLMNKTIIHFGMMFISNDDLVIHGNGFLSVFIFQNSLVLNSIFSKKILNIITGDHIIKFLISRIPSIDILRILYNENPGEIKKIENGREYKIKVTSGTLENLWLPFDDDENCKQIKKSNKSLDALKRAIGNVRLGPGLNTEDVFDMRLWFYNLNKLGDALNSAYKTEYEKGEGETGRSVDKLSILFLQSELSGSNVNYETFDKTAYGTTIARENFPRISNCLKYVFKILNGGFGDENRFVQEDIEMMTFMMTLIPKKLMSDEWPKNNEELQKILRKFIFKNKKVLDVFSKISE